ncbi:MAG: hypothetical protein FP825_10135 [Hyphomonas sp.]|uniref:hypothetical protein n=1 Tax=Hyphomonas sp. TaxID=87 RepID=UPI00181298BE|nr:hypothetical protein [Hyphomonas sp.]MBA3068828.1 hypothetical protein [Hyphomonas sp.]MBU3919551.1 hypothetical protein [Alphaproteobacteria bacterium]MBU4062961.1 hypothetical protein [Alphaproteobacteria bacterium]MBU4165493.1 hypothetical protein [Alphaproteobacteria bacterium]
MSEYKSVWVRAGRQKKEEKKLLGRGMKLIDDPHQADLADLSAQIETACNSLHKEGYDVISILPSVSGHSEKGVISQGGYGFGFSVTDGVVITARRRAS